MLGVEFLSPNEQALWRMLTEIGQTWTHVLREVLVDFVVYLVEINVIAGILPAALRNSA